MLLANHPLPGKTIPSDTASRLSIRAAEDVARFSLRIDPASAGAAGAAFGAPLPTRIGGMVEAGGRTALQLGPDEWVLTAPVAEGDGIADAFAALPEPHSLVDVGHREVGILVQGEAAALALRSAIAFDVEAMPVGSGCRTLFDRAQIVLVREDEHRFRIEVWRSFADHVWGLLHAVSREIALGI
ncbi:sarcosine oxidase subunit gamma family protein [Azospirillum sp.]|uniref:sarcosine oxidase subunit gamma family protein n=1 Tax=Azospirillum sp. TaxID=34012 RepID=UPI002D2636BB|nr:sarcosine oxidase subunit gamma family protein [Azospirillum sp.]HYF86608.1 sarcosine oxidase subunit gamma family protein [Azospirillum sp.]